MKRINKKSILNNILIFIVVFFLSLSVACDIDPSNLYDFDLEFAKVEMQIDDEIVTNIELPLKSGEALITWKSSDEKIITNEGKVTRPSVDTEVTLTCEFTFGNEVKSFSKKVLVKAEINKPIKEYDSIVSILDGKKDIYSIKGTVVAINKQSFLVEDDTSIIMVYCGAEWNVDVEIGDVLEITGTISEFGKAKQFTKEATYTKVSTSTNENTPETLSYTEINEIIKNDRFIPKYVTIKGVFIKSGIYYNLSIDGCDALITINYSLSESDFEYLNNREIEITGYITGYYNDKFINFIYESTDSKLVEPESISNVINSPLGGHLTQGTVVAINKYSFIISDNTANILIYRGTSWICDLELGDVVKVNGPTSIYGNSIQFGVDSTYKIVSKDIVNERNPIELSGSDLNSYINLIPIVPTLVKVSGLLTVNGNYYNVTVEDSNLIVSISYPIDDLTIFNGKNIEITGYLTSVTGESTYANILSKSIIEISGGKELEEKSITEILTSEVGKYTTVGIVVAKNTQSFIISDRNSYILVYKGSSWVNDLNIGDYIKLEGTTTIYGNSLQFGTDANYELLLPNNDFDYPDPLILNTDEFDAFFNKEQIIIESIELTGILIQNGDYYNIQVPGSEYLGSLSYPLNPYLLTLYNGEEVKVTAFVTSYKSIYLNMTIIDIKKTNESEKKDDLVLRILELNDTHGYIKQDEYGKNGLSNIAYLVNSIRDESPLDDVILLSAGDMFQGTAISNITHGLTVIDAMNAMKFDCMVVGNHEFDWGIKEILKYFDNDLTNGEADFPLLSANIYNNNGSLLTIDNGKMFESTIIKKEGVKVGILGYIGDVYSSISYVMAKDYYFDNNISGSVEKLGGELKKQGADIIVVAIHGGDSSSIENYNINYQLSQLMYNNEYLVDAVINGHTHSTQTGYITRANGMKLPLVQAGCNALGLGDIALYIDRESKSITNVTSRVHSAYEADRNYDTEVENVINNALVKYNDVLTEVYGTAGETVNSRSDLYTWIGNVMCKATGADISICNTGGVRATGDINKGDNITIENMYMINPFDNYVMLVDVKGSDITRFIERSSVFYGTNGISLSSIVSSKTYKVAVIDYVYYYDTFPSNNTTVNTNIIMRDMLIEDIKAQKVFYPITKPDAKLDNLVE